MRYYAIKILANEADPQDLELNDLYVSDYEPDIDDLGRGHLQVTKTIAKAKIFLTPREAVEFYRQQSKRKPLRSDGRPNRPLTAFTVEIKSHP